MAGDRFSMAVVAVVGLVVSPARLSAETNPHFAVDGQPSGSCATCHAAASTASRGPRWQTAALRAGGAYDSVTFDAKGRGAGPGAASVACLSCHDGTAARAVHNGGRSLGNDLSDDHPIGFVYDASLAHEDGGLHDPTLTPSGLGGTIAEDLLVDGRLLECTACHDPHRQSANGSYLRLSTAGSALCLTCHDK